MKIRWAPLFLLLFFTHGQAQEEPARPTLFWMGERKPLSQSQWRDLDLNATYPTQIENLHEVVRNLKLQQNLRCGQSIALFELSLPSLGNRRFTARLGHSPQGTHLTLDLFGRQGETYTEKVRTSFEVYTGDNNRGRLRLGSVLNLQTQESSRQGLINQPYMSSLHKALTGEEQRIESNSPLARQWLSAVQLGDAATACCMNTQCRNFLKSVQPDSPPRETRRAEATP